MQINDFYKNIFHNLMENLLILLVGLIVAVALLAIICGDGNKGIIDLL
jgi:hypothetical protein